MIQTLAVHGYRSLRELVLPLGRLNLVTGANGSGKSSLYRALRLLADAASNQVVASLAREGGLPFTLWAGPETISRSMKLGEHKVEGTRRKHPISLRLGFVTDDFGYSIDLGYPPPAPIKTMFQLDPAIKKEVIWYGPLYRRSALLVERDNNFVYLPVEAREEPTILTQELSSADSMLAAIADPQRAPEMLAVRESIRRWRFYDGFRTDMSSPVRVPQIGTFTPVLSSEGTDVAAALQTIAEFDEDGALPRTIDDAFPGSRLEIRVTEGRFEAQLWQPGILRPLSAAELSDGTLRYLLWTAALMTPRPPDLMVLNEPETSLHPDLLPALARLIANAAKRTQVIVVSHSQLLIEQLERAEGCKRLQLQKVLGETVLDGATLFNTPKWVWPAR